MTDDINSINDDDDFIIINDEKEPPTVPLSTDKCLCTGPECPPLTKEDEEFNRRLIEASEEAEKNGFLGVDENLQPTNDYDKLLTVLRGVVW